MKTCIAITCLIALVVAGLLGLWLNEGPPAEAVQSGILAPFDLKDGRYAIVVNTGEAELRQHPGAPLVRVINDQELIAQCRDEVDVSYGLTDFLPAEGGPWDIYLYVFRNGVKVAGKQVTQANRIKLPEALIAVSHLVRVQNFSGFREAYLRERDRLVAQGALIINQSEVGPPGHEHYFSVNLPTVTVLPSEQFDPEAYADVIADRIRKALPGMEYDLSVHLDFASPEGQIALVDENTGLVRQTADGQSVTLSGVILHQYSVDVSGAMEIHGAFEKLDLSGLVADRHDEDLVLRAWQTSTGTHSLPAVVEINGYDTTATLTAQHRRKYSLTFVDPTDIVELSLDGE